MNTTMSATMSCFRLFDLPLDLLELLTLYFKSEEVVKLLTVSSNFHDIFARSVWHTITINTIRIAEPVRSSAYARYGHLVRSIDLIYSESEFDSHNWAQLFPNTTSMSFDIISEMNDCDKQTFMNAIAGLHGLRSLKVNMETKIPPFDLETLATTLVARHRDPSKQSLRKLTIRCIIKEGVEDKQKKSWADLSAFVQALSPLRPSINLKIDMDSYGNMVVPTPVQMDTLRSHLSVLPSFGMVEDEDGCAALHNRQLFSPSGTPDDPLGFDRLGILDLYVCCASPLLFDYSDFTPLKFPAMDTMIICEDECSHQTEEGAGSAIQLLLTQKWPKLKYITVYGSRSTLDPLNTLIDLNPQLTDLTIEVYRNTVDINGVFMLERVTGRLPHLAYLTLYGESSMLVDSDWLRTSSLVDIRSSKLGSISIHRTMLAPRLFEVILALSNLGSISFGKCVLPEPELVKMVFKKHRPTVKEYATVGIRRLTIDTPTANNNWSLELILELIAALPHLESCIIYGDTDLNKAIKKKHPRLYR
ncbi:hypothetical protein GQ42DRAFT_72273 [Ramicandelaber brevisporus]|nr:hypothetical protein GQ42DRAFT_72273 [Ramicandelaber brevisporus]